MAKMVSNILAALNNRLVTDGRSVTRAENARMVFQGELNGSSTTLAYQPVSHNGVLTLGPNTGLPVWAEGMRHGQLSNVQAHFDVCLGAKDSKGHFRDAFEWFSRNEFPRNYIGRPAFVLDDYGDAARELLGMRFLGHPKEVTVDIEGLWADAVRKINDGDMSDVPAVVRADNGKEYRLKAVGPTRVIVARRDKLVLCDPRKVIKGADGREHRKTFALDTPQGMVPCFTSSDKGALLQKGEAFFKFDAGAMGPVADALRKTLEGRVYVEEGGVRYVRMWYADKVAFYCGKCLGENGLHKSDAEITCACGHAALPGLRMAKAVCNTRHYLVDIEILVGSEDLPDVAKCSHVERFVRQYGDQLEQMVVKAKEEGYRSTVPLPEAQVA